jgi:O-succinylbenzoate synthase
VASLAAGGRVTEHDSSVGAELDEVELVRVRMPLRRAHRDAHGTEEVRDVVLVRASLDDGTEGWGECSALSRPTYTAEHTAGAWTLLRDELVPARLASRTTAVVGHPMATAALLTAEADAHLRRAGRSLVDQLVGLHHTPVPLHLTGTGHVPAPAAAVPVSAVVGLLGPIDDVLAAVAEHVDAKVAMVKLKVTPDPVHLDAVRQVREAWPALRLAVDFNGTADLAALAALDGLDLAYVEQPAGREALVESAFFVDHTDIPVALDESVTGPGTLASAIALRAASIVNVKPARVGGPYVAAGLVADAANAGWQCFVGGMLETGVGRASAVAVAALPGCKLPTDLGPSERYFESDITEPLGVDAMGRIVVPDAPGIGRAPDPVRLAEVAVDRVVVAR